MKKYLFMAIAALCAASCLTPYTYYSSTPVTISFDELLYSTTGVCVFSSDDEEYIASSFYDNGLNFFTRLDDDNNYTGGFCISRLSDTTVFTHSTVEPFASTRVYGLPVAKDTILQANLFAVYRDEPDTSKMPTNSMTFAFSGSGTIVLTSVKVNNTQEMVAASYGGAGYSSFKKGDWIKVVFTGYMGDEVTGTAECYLFDWTDPDVRTIVKKWTSVDLSPLQAVDRIQVNLLSNRDSFPRYVCLDDMAGTVTIGSKD